MQNFKYLIIGGGIAGTSAAESIRFHDKEAGVAIVTQESSRLYSRVMLPKFLREEVPFDHIYLRKPADYQENNISLITDSKVTQVNTQGKKVTLENGEEVGYERLLIASGGKVNKLDLPGKDLTGVNYLRTDKDAQRIKEEMKKAKNALVVGAGFIGIEFAQSFIKAGLSTTLVIREPYFWDSMVGENMGRLISKILQENGGKILPNTQVVEFLGTEHLTGVKLDSGEEVNVDIAGIGVGIQLELEYLKSSGIALNKGVLTNEYLEANQKDVWAAGDSAEFYDTLFEKNHLMGNWSNSGAQGRLVGPNIAAGWGAQGREKFTTVSSYTIAIFGSSFTFLGDLAADENIRIVERGSVEEGKLGRIHLRGKRIVGAALLNLPADRGALTSLIKNKTEIQADTSKLADPSFDLSSLLAS